MIDEVRHITVGEARPFIERYHYSKVMPRVTKVVIGGIKDGFLVGVCTLGYGTQPKHTIQKLFPSLGVEDYFEIGKLCLAEHMPRNSESAFLSRVIRLVKSFYGERKILYTWADGILGKPGYVYQASNFYYGQYIWTWIYLNADGVKVHHRTLQGIAAGRIKTGRFYSVNYEAVKALGFTKYCGLQFRYAFPLCSRKEWRELRASSTIQWIRGGYPKDVDCKWKVQVSRGTLVECGMPPFRRGEYVKPFFAEEEWRQKHSGDATRFQREEGGSTPTLPLQNWVDSLNRGKKR